MSTQFLTVHIEDESAVVKPRGSWKLASYRAQQAAIDSIERSQARRWIIDGRELDYLDTSAAMQLLRFIDRQRPESSESVQFRECSAEVQSILRLVAKSLDNAAPLRRPDILGWLSRIGRTASSTVTTLDEILCFVGQITLAAFQLLRQPQRFRPREVSNQIQAVGFDAVGIVCLVTFLIGIVVAYLTGIQLEQYGANVFIVDGIGLGMTRELAPILVAIVVAGRSGSAFTAQLGTMKLNQEIDAAETMGLSAIQVLVLPRVLALMIALPLLVFLGDVAGILGGLVASDLRLGVSAATFLDRLQVVLPLKTVFVGLFKAPVFAFFIAAIACHLGLTTEANAQSVGENTTKTVVRAIVAVILLNATFAVLFSELGI